MPRLDLPQVGTDPLAALGIATVDQAVVGALGWAFRALPTSDYGLDGQIEIVVHGTATGRIFSAQIKCGESFFLAADESGWTVRIKKRTVNYWRAHSVPVLLVLVHPVSRVCYWVYVGRGSRHVVEGRNAYRVRVPRGQTLDAGARAAMLDLESRSFVTTDRQFGHQLEPGRAFHHARPLMGRRAELGVIVAAASEPDPPLVVEVAGRGGTGKSRLLLEAARRVQELDDMHVRWVRDNGVLDPHAEWELPPGPLLLIVDDAHLHADLRSLYALTRSRGDRTLLVLGFQPIYRPAIRAAARAASVPLEAIRVIPNLRELAPAELRPLLRSELGPGLEHYADRIIRRAQDSTLVALAAARVIREERIPIALLERSSVFRHEVLTRFEDVILGGALGPQAGRSPAAPGERHGAGSRRGRGVAQRRCCDAWDSRPRGERPDRDPGSGRGARTPARAVECGPRSPFGPPRPPGDGERGRASDQI